MNLIHYGKTNFLKDLKRYQNLPEELRGNVALLHRTGDQIALACEYMGINPHDFILCVYVESVMMAAVRTHDLRHYEKYTKTLNHAQLLGPFSNNIVTIFPQNMLVGISWSEQSCQSIQMLFTQTVGHWVEGYDRLTGTSRSGQSVIESLIYDTDVKYCPPGVPTMIMAAVERGILEAGKNMGIVYDPNRERIRKLA